MDRVGSLLSLTCSRFCYSRRQRRLSGKVVVLLLVIIVLERFAYATIGGLVPVFLSQIKGLSGPLAALVASLTRQVFAPFFYPLAGWIADAWVGRYRAIKYSLGILWIGYAGLAFSFSFHLPESIEVCLLITWTLLIAMGSAGVDVNILPFGADQIQYKTSEELSSYFYWYYWCRNLAWFVEFLHHSCAFFTKNTSYFIITLACITVGAVTLALVLLFILGGWLSDDHLLQNPPKLICSVLSSAASAKRPQARSAFSFSDSVQRPKRFDLAKYQHGGRFSSEEVEDVKTFGRVLLLMFSVGGALTVYSGVSCIVLCLCAGLISSLCFR